MPEPRSDPDVLLVGAGLASSLIAMAIKAKQPDLQIQLLEERPGPDDHHTWCLFESDVTARQWAELQPMLATVWPAHEVRFPLLSRTISGGYGRITSASLDAARDALVGRPPVYGARVSDLTGTDVRLDDGRRLSARLVIDGRGAQPSSHLSLAWQKFVGLELELTQPHRRPAPLIMDATVRQADGYRFFYVLPLGETRVLVEDTRYADGPQLDVPALSAEVSGYAHAQGWRVADTIRRESGVLPIVLGGDIDAYWRDLAPDIAPVGMRALLFHPTTGYSLPEAVRLASAIAEEPELTTAAVRRLVEGRSKALWRRSGYARLLNRLLFQAAAPDERYRVLQRFYALPSPLIRRFYANRLTLGDKLRILSGRPPVSVSSALRVVMKRESTLG